MTSLMHLKLLPRAKARRTDVDAVARLAHQVRTFDPDGVGEVAVAAVAVYLETRLIYSWVTKFT